MTRRLCGLLLCVGVFGCRDDDPGATEGTGATQSASGDTGDNGAAGGAVLGCPVGDDCTLVLVSQTLDDRVEIFAPDEFPSYRGAIDLDLKPNVMGDYADGRLDEPFGVARAGGYLHVALGHYPSRDNGSLVSFPLTMFDAAAQGSTLAASDYFADGVFSQTVVANDLKELEPIFLLARGSRLLVGTFNNDLFATEDTWTMPGKLLVLDANDPGAAPGVVDLGILGCNGAAQVIDLGASKLGVACDGNERIAVLDVGDLDNVPLSDVAATITGTVCEIPGATEDRRVRYLAGDGSGGFLVAEGPTPLSLTSGTRMWHFEAGCGNPTVVSVSGSGQIGEVEAFPAAQPTWLVAAAGVLDPAARGVMVVQSSGGQLEVCQTLPGFDAHWESEGGPIEPFGLAVRPDGTAVAVGAGPFQSAAAGPGYGKVLWAQLDGIDDPCTMTATVTDLTAGGGAPAENAGDAGTFRRAPNVVELVEISG